MATLENLVRSILPAAVRLGPGGVARATPGTAAPAIEAAGRPVGWVRVMRPRVPAFDALEAGDLVIVPEGALSAIVHDAGEAADVADELQRADVAGVVLLAQPDSTADQHGRSEATEAFVARAAAGSLPIFREVGVEEAPLERALIRYLVNERAELDRQVARLEAELQAVALEGGGLRAMAATIAGALRRAVAIEDAEGGIVALHAPPDSPSAALVAARYEARREPAALSVELPGGGRLALLGDGEASEFQRTAGERIAVLLALEFARDAALRRTEDRRAEMLPAEGPPWVVVMARQVLPGEEVPVGERERRRDRVRRLAPARRLVLRGDAASVELRGVAAAVADDPRGLELAGRVARLLERPVAVSKPFGDPAGRPAADAEARAVLEAGDELAEVQAAPSVLRADRLSMYRMLGSLHNLPDGQRHGRALLQPLLVGSPRAQHERLATLRALLDGGGQAEAAAALRVHRNTIAYRLRRAEELTGWDLRDPDLRFALGLAIRIVQTPQD